MRQRTSDGRADWRTGGPVAPLALLLLSACPPVRLSAQELPTNAGALFLLFPVGAQAVAMGQTAAALDGRGEAAFWNPAGLATMERSEVALNTASLAAGPTHALTAYFPSRGLGVLGAAVYLVDYGNLERTDSASVTIGRIAAGGRDAQRRLQAPGEQPRPGRSAPLAPPRGGGVSNGAPRRRGRQRRG